MAYLYNQWLNQGVTDYSRPTAARGNPLAGISNLAALYNPSAYGTVPVVPPTTTNRQITDTSGMTTGADVSDVLSTGSTTGRTSMTGGTTSQSVTDAIRNILSNTREVSSWVPNIPGYENLASTSSADVQNWLEGNLDPQAIADAGTWAAQRGITTGLGVNSPNALSAYQHFLGISRQKMQEKGLEGYLQLLAQSPRTTTRDVSGETTETGRTTTDSSTSSWQDTESYQDTVNRTLSNIIRGSQTAGTSNVASVQDNNLLAAMYSAAPNPYAAAMANLAAQGLGIREGRGSVAPVALPNTVSFPRAAAAQPIYRTEPVNSGWAYATGNQGMPGLGEAGSYPDYSYYDQGTNTSSMPSWTTWDDYISGDLGEYETAYWEDLMS